jgi:hypothetical protein
MGQETLMELGTALRELVSFLRKDPACKWTSKFEADLADCQNLLDAGGAKEDVIALSKSITEVFQGMGSFNDYSPSTFDRTTGRYTSIPGTERFDAVSTRVFDLAVSLRATK